MGRWKVSIPVGSMRELELTLEYTKNVDLSVFYFYQSLGMDTQGPPNKLVECLYPYRQYIHSMHMSNGYAMVGRDGRFVLDYDIEIMRALEISCGVLHLRKPRNAAGVARELAFLAPHVTPGITIALENLRDSNNVGAGFRWIRVPDQIAAFLKNSQLPQFGLCLDTSHALSLNELEWDTPAIRASLMAIHLSDGRPGRDEHGSLDDATDQRLVGTALRIMKVSEHDGVAVLEQTSHRLSLESLEFLRGSFGKESDWLDI